VTDSLEFPEYTVLRPEGEEAADHKGKGREGGVEKSGRRIEIVSVRLFFPVLRMLEKS
jgi:hypothetical protein